MRLLVLLLAAASLAAAADTCAPCHPAIVRAYQKNSMARSLRAVAPEHLAQTGAYYHANSGTHFAMLARGGKLYQRRWQIGFDGKDANVEELEVNYVLGSGKHARTYLHRDFRGMLVELPLGWYAEKSGYFAMNPGYDSAAPPTRRKIDFDCMFCHNAYPGVAAGGDPVYSRVPEGIDCARCHGPGGRHIGAAKSGLPVAQIRSAIVNPARLSRDRQMDVCMQCHLETTSARLPAMLKRFDRGPFTWNPGEPLDRLLIAFDHAPNSGREDKFEIVNSAYRLRQSACFQKSATLTCGTCHTPHGAAREGDAACQGCHAARAATHPARKESCASCHMPKRRSEDAVHTVMTDHLIQRRPPVRDLLAELPERQQERGSYRGPVVPYYPSPLPATAENALYVAAAQVLHGTNLEAGVPQLAGELAKSPAAPAEFFAILGNGWLQLGRPLEAIRVFRGVAGSAKSLGLAMKQSGDNGGAEAVFLKALATAPEDAGLWFELALLDSGRGLWAKAIKRAQRAIALDPDLIEAYNTLAANQTSMGDLAGAESTFRSGLRVDPFSATLQGNLARLLASKADRPQALFHFAQAVRLRPGFAPDRYEHALALVQDNQFSQAREQVEEAIRLDPKMVEALTLLGGLLARTGDYGGARQRYEAAVKIRPDFGRAQVDLARVLRAEGDLPGAIEHLRAAIKSSDPESAALALRALVQLGAQP